jgi:hypothetical protein
MRSWWGLGGTTPAGELINAHTMKGAFETRIQMRETRKGAFLARVENDIRTWGLGFSPLRAFNRALVLAHETVLARVQR